MIKLTHLITNYLDLPKGDIVPETEIRDLLDDSLDLLELVLFLEESYETDILEEDLNKIITVQDLFNYLTHDGNTSETKA